MTSEQPPLEEFGETGTDHVDNEWEEMILSDVISINDYPSAEKGEEYRSVGMSDVARDQRKVDDWEYKEYSYSRPRFRNGQTLMARITPCLENGKTAFVDILDDSEVAIGSTEFIVLSDTDRTLPKFVYYTARRPDIRQFAIKRMTGTSGRQRVPLDIFDNKKINLPPIREQKKIVSVLDAIDSKIETNSQITQALEEIAQALYKSWFVDFEPYSEFKNSKLGNIPKEFKIANLGDLVSLGRGYSYSSEFLDKENDSDESYPMINLKNVREGGGFRDDGYKYYTEDSLKSRYKIETGDLIVAITDLTQEGRVIGSPALIPKLSGDTNIISQDVAKVEPEVADRKLFYHLFKSKRFQDYAGSVSTGTTVLHLSLESLREYELACPPESKIEEFHDIAQPIHSQKLEIVEENERLRSLRDTLLPKLMSGEIRVNDIELDELEVDSEV